MSIRFATQNDVPFLVETGRVYHSLTRFKAYEYNAERVAQQLTKLIVTNSKSHCFFVADDKVGKPYGGLIGCIEHHIFSDEPVANVIHYDVLPDKRMGGAALRLLTAFKRWAENRGAVEVCCGVNSGVHLNRTDRFLRRLGFQLTGGNYSLAGTRRG
jgi:N-acetylglutamate synthase-like GNAT family acetyltransferase